MATAKKSRKVKQGRKKSAAGGGKAVKARPRARAAGKPAVRAKSAVRRKTVKAARAASGARSVSTIRAAGAKSASKAASSKSGAIVKAKKMGKETPVRKGKKPDLRSIKKELINRREELLGKLGRLTTSAVDVNDKPVGDRADDASFDLEIDSSYSIAEREAEELRLINVALDKIASGTYGVCEECGQLIESPRLKALPYAVMCLKCKQNEELSRHAESSDIVYGGLEEE